MTESEAPQFVCGHCKEEILIDQERRPYGKRFVHLECARLYMRMHYERRNNRKVNAPLGPRETPQLIEGGQVCLGCKIGKPFEEFYKNPTYVDGYEFKCKACRLKKRKTLWDENINGHKDRDRARNAARSYEERSQEADYNFAWRLKTRFKMTVGQYEEMYAAQNGLCACCGNPETKIHHTNNQVSRLCVDHDHACCPAYKSCGKCIRGLLCYYCNQTLGQVELIGLDQIADYLSGFSLDAGSTELEFPDVSVLFDGVDLS